VFVDSGPPTVAITAPDDSAVVTAPTNIIGTASSPILQSYLLEYRLKPAEQDSIDTTVGNGQSAGTAWSVLVSNTVSVVSNTLAVFDPTLLLNGIYELRLTATDTIGRSTMTEPITLIVDRNLKLGHFTISFSDLTVPVAGLPLQITRTYDSRAAAAGIKGDFGIGWTLDIRNVRLQKNRPLGRNWEETVSGGVFPTYALDSIRPRIVTITFPDGRQEKFAFEPNPMVQPLLPIDYPQWNFRPIGNTRGTLVPAGYDDPDGSFLIVVGPKPGIVNLYDLNYFLDNPLGTEEQLNRNPTLFRYTSPEGYSYLIDEIAGLQSVTDPNGNTLLISTNGLTWTNTFAGTNTLSIAFQRDTQGRITNIVDAAGNAMSYAYDDIGNLITFIDRVGNTNGFAYTNAAFPHYLTAIVDGRGVNALQNLYDATGRIVSTIDAAGKVIGYHHDLANNREYITNRLGYVTVNQYDYLGRLVSKTDASGVVTTFTYDKRDNLLSVSNAACSCATQYAYDNNDNLIAHTDELGRTIRYSYTGLGKVLTYTDADGNTTTNSYDARGNLLSTTDALGNTTSFTYNNRGQVLSMTDPRGGVTRFDYDDFGRLVAEVNALGHTTYYTSDANGNLTSITRRRTLASESEVKKMSGLKMKSALGDSSLPPRYTNITFSYTYDSAGHVLSVLLPDGSSISNRYDPNGHITHSIDQLGRQTSTVYNDLGKPIQVTYPDGTTESMQYDAEGQLTDHYDRGGRHTHFSYDPNGRITQVTYPDGHTVTATYDDRGRLIAESDACHGTTTYAYDAVGNRISSTDPLGRTTTYTYNAKRACTSVTDPFGRVTTMEYDALNRNTRIIYPNGSTKSAIYAGRLTPASLMNKGRHVNSPTTPSDN